MIKVILPKIENTLSDPDAIHVNLPNEIAGIDEELLPTGTDILVIENQDSSPDQWGKNKIAINSITMDILSDGTNYVRMETAERTKLSDITSSGADIADAVSKRHVQGTDTTLGILTQNIDLGSSYKVINSIEPTLDTDLATKYYVDNNGGSGEDPNAIHVNLPNEINGIDEELLPTGSDILVIENQNSSPDQWSKNKIAISSITMDVLSDGTNYVRMETTERTKLADITSSGTDIADAVSKRHVQGTDTTLGILSQDIDLGSLHKVINSIEPTIDTDLATKYYVDTHSGNETLTLVELTEIIVLNDTCYGNYYLCDTTSNNIIITLPQVTLQTKGKQVGFIYNKYISYNLSTVLIMVDTGDVINNGDQSILLHPSESMIFVHDGINRWSILNLQTNTSLHINRPEEIVQIDEKSIPFHSDIILIEDSQDSYSKKSILLSSILNFGYKSYMMPCEYSANLGARRVRSVGTTQRFNFHIPYDFKDFGGTGGVFVCGFPSSGAAQPGRIVEVTIDHDSGPGTAYNNISTFNTVTYDLTGYTDSLWMLPIASYMNPSAGITGGIYLNHTLLGGLIRYIGTMVIYK